MSFQIFARVEQRHLALRRDQHRAIALSDIHEMNLEFSVRLTERQRRQHQGQNRDRQKAFEDGSL